MLDKVYRGVKWFNFDIDLNGEHFRFLGGLELARGTMYKEGFCWLKADDLLESQGHTFYFALFICPIATCDM